MKVYGIKSKCRLTGHDMNRRRKFISVLPEILNTSSTPVETTQEENRRGFPWCWGRVRWLETGVNHGGVRETSFNNQRMVVHRRELVLFVHWNKGKKVEENF